jgi:tetratricopeptide (TPR) repeat protein
MRAIGASAIVGGGLAAALMALAACSQQQGWAACRMAGRDVPALQRQVAACDAIARSGAKGADVAAALRLQAEALHGLGDNDDALAALDRAIGLKPADAALFADRGLVLLDMRQGAKAMHDLDHAISLDPQNAVALVNRGLAEVRSGDDDAAISDEDEAIVLRPDWPSPWIDRGYAYAGKHEYDMALADFADALRADPKALAAYHGQALAHGGKGDDGAAIEDYGRAIAVKPDDAEALERRADLYLARGDVTRAASDLVDAADAHFESRDYGGAIALASRAIQLNPDGANALNERCWIRAVADRELASALADCQRSLAARPLAANTLDSLAFVYFRMGRLEAAVEAYDAALAQNSQLSSSLFVRGVAKQRLGQRDDGQSDIDAARGIDATIDKRFAAWGVTPQ